MGPLVTHEEIEEIVSRAVVATLATFGIEKDDHKEIKADFDHLRRWRKSVEQAQSYTLKVVVTTIAGGIIGAIWLGFQTMMHK